jgi:hypothetical protein
MRFLLAAAFCLLMFGQANAVTCPVGDVLFGGHCIPAGCAPGTHGTPPNCIPNKCRAGQLGTPPNCSPIPFTLTACPAGMVGVYPNCSCRPGTHGVQGSSTLCIPNKCPPNTTGTPPNCKGHAM